MSGKTSIDGLPVEIKNIISKYLSSSGLQALRATCRRIRRDLGIAHDPWAHLHISIPGEEDMDNMKPHVDDDCERYCKPEATIFEHVCKRGFIKIDKGNIRQFVLDVLDGLYFAQLKRVQTISISGCLFLQKDPIDYKFEFRRGTRAQCNEASRATLYRSLLNSLATFCINLKTISVAAKLETFMIQTDIGYNEDDRVKKSATIPTFLQKRPACKKEIYIDTNDSKKTFQTFRNSMRGIKNIITLQLDGPGAVRYLYFMNEHNPLEQSIRRLETYNGLAKRIPVHAFKLFFSRCVKLKQLSIEACSIVHMIPASLDWVPPSTQSMRIREYCMPDQLRVETIGVERLPELTLVATCDSLKSLWLESFVGEIFFMFEFPNLETLGLEWVPLLHPNLRACRNMFFDQRLKNMKKLKQLQFWNLSWTALNTDQLNELNIESLAMVNASQVDFSRILTVFPHLKFLYVTVEYREDLESSVKHLVSAAAAEQEWTELVIETLPVYVDWLVPLDGDKIYDQFYTKVEPHPQYVPYRVDLELFRDRVWKVNEQEDEPTVEEIDDGEAAVEEGKQMNDG